MDSIISIQYRFYDNLVSIVNHTKDRYYMIYYMHYNISHDKLIKINKRLTRVVNCYTALSTIADTMKSAHDLFSYCLELLYDITTDIDSELHGL